MKRLLLGRTRFFAAEAFSVREAVAPFSLCGDDSSLASQSVASAGTPEPAVAGEGVACGKPLLTPVTARTPWNRAAMRTRIRMAQERAYPVRGLGREDVLELTRLVFDLMLV